MVTYEHRQPGYVVRWAMGLGALFVTLVTVPLMLAEPAFSLIPIVVIAILVAAGLLFHSLTVQVTTAYLSLWYGPGLVRKRWAIEDIVDAQAVRNPWWYGWGIHLTPRGWIYNVSGWEGIEIALANGRRLRIGTDEPGALVVAIEAARAREWEG